MTHESDQPSPEAQASLDQTSLERVANQPASPAGGFAGMTDHQFAAALAPLRQRIEDLNRRLADLERRFAELEAKDRS